MGERRGLSEGTSDAPGVRIRATPCAFQGSVRDHPSGRQLGEPGNGAAHRRVDAHALREALAAVDDAMAAPAHLDQRIDLVLFHGKFEVDSSTRVGGRRMHAGLWPSDHLGVVATLDLP